MTPTSLDLFADPEIAGAPALQPVGIPSSITATGTGMPPEWGPYALDIVFADRKQYRKAYLTPAASADLVHALWTYALARHESTIAQRVADTSVLLGHRSRKDKLNEALCLIESHGIMGQDIPPAREFGPSFDLRHLAGESPFPVAETA
ncbi:hypothetical protein [Variovorax sp. RA8]|uniref:hypothetical protein n=1 Tax=Variovorax sp. (strain JCM 16519 / RA8) TaxID=662548 RepID=UPI000A6B5315|nr:hypothetical protein [Variovorax sp. RA8]VTU44928.1 hypothetical protein RA8P2_00364 [Variovorax sp. RA8]